MAPGQMDGALPDSRSQEQDASDRGLASQSEVVLRLPGKHALTVETQSTQQTGAYENQSFSQAFQKREIQTVLDQCVENSSSRPDQTQRRSGNPEFRGNHRCRNFVASLPGAAYCFFNGQQSVLDLKTSFGNTITVCSVSRGHVNDQKPGFYAARLDPVSHLLLSARST